MSHRWDTLNYNRFDNVEDSSESEGDGHPNIDMDSWKRMKGRMRKEKGLPPRGVELRDAYNLTKVNKTKNNPDEDSEQTIDEFVKKHREKLETYALTPDDEVADKFLQDHTEIVNHSGEGFLITLAVNKSCEGEPASLNVPLMAKRCLTVHNIVASAKDANIKIEKAIKMFFKGKNTDRIGGMYQSEFEKQHDELMTLIRKRTKERLAEEAEVAKEPLELTPEQIKEYKAPVGPGGLDPSEVLNSLPTEMREAFLAKDTEKLKDAISNLSTQDAEKYMADCVKSGLWVNPTTNEPEGTEKE